MSICNEIGRGSSVANVCLVDTLELQSKYASGAGMPTFGRRTYQEAGRKKNYDNGIHLRIYAPVKGSFMSIRSAVTRTLGIGRYGNAGIVDMLDILPCLHDSVEYRRNESLAGNERCGFYPLQAWNSNKSRAVNMQLWLLTCLTCPYEEDAGCMGSVPR